MFYLLFHIDFICVLHLYFINKLFLHVSRSFFFSVILQHFIMLARVNCAFLVKRTRHKTRNARQKMLWKVKCERNRRATTLKTRRRLKRRRMEFVLCRFYRTLQIHLYLDTHDTLPLLLAAKKLFSWPCKQLLSKEMKYRQQKNKPVRFLL